MSVTCSCCNSRVQSHSRCITCPQCKKLFHLNCVPLDMINDRNLFHSDICHVCLIDNFPFNIIEEDDIFRANLSRWSNQDTIIHNQENCIFNPFDIDEMLEKQSDLLQCDPDLNFYNNYQCIQNIQNCSYYTDLSFNNKIDDHILNKDCLGLIHFNIRSLAKNYRSADVFLSSLNFKFTVVAFSETWLNENNYDCYCLPGYVLESRFRTNKCGGGVSLMIRQTVKYKVREDLILFSHAIESLFIELKGDKNIIIGVIYRPPGGNIEDFNDTISGIIDKLKLEKKLLYLLGDFNINLINSDSHIPTSEFLDLLYSVSLIPLINRPTRITTNTATLIDNIFCNDVIDLKHFNGIFCNDITDHYPVFSLNLGTYTEQTQQYFIKSRKVNKSTISVFKEKLSNIDWSNIMQNQSAQCAFTDFYQSITGLYDTTFPVTNVQIRYSNKKPWLCQNLKKSIRLKNKLYVIQRKHPTAVNIAKYKRYKLILSKVLNKSERDYYQNLIEANRSDAKKTWKVIKDILCKSQNDHINNTFNINNTPVSDPHIIANSFNKFYVNIGPSLSQKNSQTYDIQPTDYIMRNIPHSIHLYEVSENELIKIIKNLKNSSHGPDGIRTDIFKETYQLFLSPLLHLLNLSIKQGYFPNELKVARVTPIFKGGDPMEIKNYRPVSILNIFSKVYEKVMYSRLFDFLNKNNVLYNLQFGFRNKYSTSAALIYLVDKIMTALDKGEFVIGTFVDLSKAFDCVNHDILLEKLHKYGIRGIAHAWFSSYLQNRSQYVVFDNVNSDKLNIVCGVPQGSILGPLLFLIYINDLENVSQKVIPVMYADDTNLFMSGTNVSDMSLIVNDELTKIMKWMKINKLSVNIEKTNYMIFRKKRKQLPNNIPRLCMDGTSIKKIDTVRFLGVKLDENLSWINHIAHVKSKIARGIGVISKARKYFNTRVLVSLYYSLIYPHLIYCVEVWGCAHKTYLKPLQTLQNRIIRVINCLRNRTNVNEFYKKLKILQISQIYVFCTGLFVFKYRKGMLPDVFQSYFQYQQHQYNTRNLLRSFEIPLYNSSFAKMRIKYLGVKIHNNLIKCIEWNNSYHTFKKNLRIYLVNNPFDIHDFLNL